MNIAYRSNDLDAGERSPTKPLQGQTFKGTVCEVPGIWYVSCMNYIQLRNDEKEEAPDNLLAFNRSRANECVVLYFVDALIQVTKKAGQP